jgi:hypothetical protein
VEGPGDQALASASRTSRSRRTRPFSLPSPAWPPRG